MTSDHRLPTWAPRVSQDEIRRFYESDAQGIYDEDLINEVGCGLFARCESFIIASVAVQGELPCPQCAQIVRREKILRCPCGWELPWADYFKTIHHKQLSRAEPVLKQFREFVNALPLARTPKDKVLLIDRLIHGFHWYYKTNGPTRPVAVNLIEGHMGEVVAFLDSLSYGEKNTPGLEENRADWNRNIEVNREWFPSRRRTKAREN
ncbi:MAG: hypothetical protein ABSE73_18505 [Planctomycetota bacterium]